MNKFKHKIFGKRTIALWKWIKTLKTSRWGSYMEQKWEVCDVANSFFLFYEFCVVLLSHESFDEERSTFYMKCFIYKIYFYYTWLKICIRNNRSESCFTIHDNNELRRYSNRHNSIRYDCWYSKMIVLVWKSQNDQNT